MTTETAFWGIAGGSLLIMLGMLGYFLRSDRERIRKEIDDIRVRFHNVNNLLAGTIGRVEFNDVLKTIRDDMKDLEHRVDRLFSKEK
jgi:hypothetical protein